MSPTEKPKTAKKGRRKSRSDFSLYIRRAFHAKHPNMTISSSAVKIVNDIVQNLFTKVVTEGKNVMQAPRKPEATFKVNTIRAAVPLLFDDFKGDLIPHMLNDAEKALASFAPPPEKPKVA